MPESLACVEQTLIHRGYSLPSEDIKKTWNRAIRAELAEGRPLMRQRLLRSLLRLPLERPYHRRRGH